VGGGSHSLARKGWDIHCGTLYIYVLCGFTECTLHASAHMLPFLAILIARFQTLKIKPSSSLSKSVPDPWHFGVDPDPSHAAPCTSGGLIFLFLQYFIQHCSICRPSGGIRGCRDRTQLCFQHWLSDALTTQPDPKKIYRLKEDQAFSLSLELGPREKFARHPSADILLHSVGGGGDFVDTVIAF
jgi:hypothetical protein